MRPVYALGVNEKAPAFIRYLQETWQMFRFLIAHKYDVIHINMEALFMCILCASLCRLFGIRHVILHSHSSNPNQSAVKRLNKSVCKPVLIPLIDAYLACSEKAAHYLFPSVIMKKRHYDIIHSGIDIERFMFKQLERDTYRKELGIEGRVAVDLVGRFDDVKNQEFAVDILCELRKMIRCVLIFVGTGERTNYIKKLVTEKNAHNDVIFLGFRNDVDSIMQALDVLILPSIYEGFPVTVVEATCCGLPCIVSGEACEKSIEVLGRIKLRSIHDTPRNWCMDIIDMLCYVRDDNSNRIREEKYSIKDTVSVLEQYYSGVDK